MVLNANTRSWVGFLRCKGSGKNLNLSDHAWPWHLEVSFGSAAGPWTMLPACRSSAEAFHTADMREVVWQRETSLQQIRDTAEKVHGRGCRCWVGWIWEWRGGGRGEIWMYHGVDFGQFCLLGDASYSRSSKYMCHTTLFCLQVPSLVWLSLHQAPLPWPVWCILPDFSWTEGAVWDSHVLLWIGFNYHYIKQIKSSFTGSTNPLNPFLSPSFSCLFLSLS